ncbi:65-kDa microtubule-associated protein 5 [Acorus gramineus]|uniref:65-kDa microtubule-associated protein 5 n=1 Tax=Acorus gramineus TaxID=55184 RepID=A0AAV9BMC2_ACOGR|nr:65-kDa microtubule-associated protein 5 [Acorus gramineus]
MSSNVTVLRKLNISSVQSVNLIRAHQMNGRYLHLKSRCPAPRLSPPKIVFDFGAASILNSQKNKNFLFKPSLFLSQIFSRKTKFGSHESNLGFLKPQPAMSRHLSPLSPSMGTTTCGSLLQELQKLWDEIGESDVERDKILLQLEQECLEVYRRKVDRTSKYKADLHRSLAEAEAEAVGLVSALGEHSFSSWAEKKKGTLKEQILGMKPVLEELRRRREDRVSEFSEVQSQIVRISGEIAGNAGLGNSVALQVDERDLTVKKLEELKAHLLELQKDKSVRLQKVDGYVAAIYELSTVMSLNFNKVMDDIHPSFCDPSKTQLKSISNDTLARLARTLHLQKQDKEERLRKLQDLGSALIEIWSLMDTPMEEQKRFDHVTRLISVSVEDVSVQGCLCMSVIEETEAEVERLNILKASKMKELVLKKQNELEEIYRAVHMDVDSDSAREILITLIESGKVDLAQLLSSMDDQIMKAKEQAQSRKDILEKVERWTHASEEESWLDDYERDQNRYSAGRGAHKNLKRAEKARILVSKIPTLVDNLIAKVKAWEEDKGLPFLYDKAPLLKNLEEFILQRQAREEEKRRSREQKRLQEQHTTEQEALYGSRPSPARSVLSRKPLGQSSCANSASGTPMGRRVMTPSSRHGISAGKERKEGGKACAVIPVNYVALPKEDASNRAGLASP